MKNKAVDESQMYPYEYYYKGRSSILIWQSHGDYDSFAIDSEGKLVEGRSELELKSVLKDDLIGVNWDEKDTIDFDKFWEIIQNLEPNKPISITKCEIILAGWNFIEDLGRSFGHNKKIEVLREPLLNECYDKIFHGNNILPLDKPYNPILTDEEIVSIRKELMSLWQLFIDQGYLVGNGVQN